MALEEVLEEVVLLPCCCRPGRGGDDYNDARGEEQDIPYPSGGPLSHDQRQAVGGVGDINNSGDDKQVDGRVWGLCWL